MKRRNLLISLSLLSITACQPQSAVEVPAAPEVASAPAVAPGEAPVAAIPPAAGSAAEKVVSPSAAPESKPAAKQKAPSAGGADKPAPSPSAVEAGGVAVAPAGVKPPEKTAAVLSEADALALAKKNGCLACHAIDKKVFGPAWRDVAAKYRGDAGAEARLTEKIAKGGSGSWGNTPMPPNPKISEAERLFLAKFVLSLK